MYQKTRPLFLLCETPLHAGSGSDLGVVDLPIQRERHTSFPKIESSSLKGALRESFETNETDHEYSDGEKHPINHEVDATSKKAKAGSPLALAFGPEDAGNEAHAGALGFTDARLLLFPIKSMKGVFAWITCPALLDRFQREMQLTELWEGFKLEGGYSEVNDTSKSNRCMPFGSSKVVFNGYVILEEYTFKTFLRKDEKSPVRVVAEGQDGQPLGAWLASQGIGAADPYWTDKLKTDIIILSDDDFKDFANLSTEVITRTKINNETGTVQKGGLFTEEYLPTESLMYSLVMSAPVFQKEEKKKDCLLKTANEVMNFFEKGLNPVIQLGGNASLGKGLLRTTLISNPKTNSHE
jgi:CRISPR-associated protein Cmr4